VDLSPLWEGVLAGYGIAIPVGAIAVLIVDLGLRRGFRPAFVAGAGAATADLVYAGLAALAGPLAAAGLSPYAFTLRLASALVLLAIGAYGLWKALPRNAVRSPGLQAGEGSARGFLQFLGLTLLNPVTIVYFSALILGRGSEKAMTAGGRAAFTVGAGVASLSWQTLLAGVGAFAHRNMPAGSQVVTRLVGNMVVIGLGARILLHMFG
jgi:threonine/homoserine/homoserine lactone efflux protein